MEWTDRGSARIRPTSDGLVEWLRSTGGRRPLVVLPPGGGNLLRYAPLVAALDERLPVVGLRLPGADARSDIVDTIEEQAEQMLAELDRVVPRGDAYRLLGWSTGGLLAWEIARRLLDRGDRVELLAHVDTYMSGAPLEPHVPVLDKYQGLLADGGVRALADEGFHRVVERSTFALARTRYRLHRRLGMRPSMSDAERRLGPVIRQAAIAYVPKFLDVPAIYFSATDSPPHQTVEPWSDLQRGARQFEVITVDGAHFVPEDRCILGPGRVDSLAEAIMAHLDRSA